MTPAQKKLRELRERQSKERGRMAELAVVDALTDEQRSELDTIEKATPDLERQIRAATVAVENEETEQRTAANDSPDAEQRERIELRSKASLTNFLLAAARGRLVDGAEAELAAAAGVSGIPLELWDVPQPERRSEDDGRETRAVAAVPGTVGVNLDPIRPAIFANSIAPRLGIAMPRVASGTYATGTITGSQSAAALAKSGTAAAAAGAITVTTATPKRVSARLELTLEDIAAVGQANFESILRENLALALSDELDKQAINGDGQAPNLKGMFNVLTPDPAAPAADVETFDRFVAIFAGGIDGLWANTVKDIGIVAGVDTYVLATKTFRDRVIDTGQRGGVSLGDESFADYAARLYGGWWTNKRMPATANHVQQGILYRKGRSAMGASAGMRTAVCPHWGEVSIDDIYSGSAKGERYFTMHVLLGDVILVQPDAYAQVAFRVST